MILIPAVLEGFRSLKDRTLKITFETNEPTPNQLKDIGVGVQKFGFLAFNVSEEEGNLQSIMEQMPKTDLEFGKTKGQRLRGVLYKLYEQDKEGYDIFDDYYAAKMEKIILHYKRFLE